MIKRIRQIATGIVVLSVGIGITVPAAAQDAVNLSLDQAVQMALEKNLSVRAAHLGTRIRMAGVTEEEARFGRSLQTSLSHRADRSPSLSSLEQVQTATSNVQSLALDVSQQLATGGRIGLTFSQNRSASNAAYNTIDPIYGSNLELSFTQPLLQGRGKINRAGIDIAANNLERSEVDLDGRIRDLTAEVRAAYWNLFMSHENLEVSRQLSDGAKRVLETARARVEMGANARSSILQAEVGVASREENIVIAEGTVRDTEDRLKSLLGLDRDPDAWNVGLIPTETPTLVPFDGDLRKGVENALNLSTAYRQQEIDLKNIDLQIDLARDDAQPAVDLSFRAGLRGIGSRYSDDLKGLGDAEGRSWQGGIAFSVPLGASASQARVQRRLIEKEQAEIDRERLRLQIAQQVREKHRQVNTDGRRAEVNLLAERLADQNVQEEEERLALGLSTVRQVLDAQDDLAEARIKRLRAIVDYNKALIEWTRFTGQ